MIRLIICLVVAMAGVLTSCDAPETIASERAEKMPVKPAAAADITLDELLTQHQQYERIPLKRMPSGHLHTLVSLNGVAGNFIVDTGAGATVLEEKKQSTFHVKASKSDKKVTGTGGAMGMQLSSGNRMKIGQLELENSSVYLMNLDHVNKAFLKMKLDEVDGIIGADVLSAKQGVIDYTNLTLYLRK